MTDSHVATVQFTNEKSCSVEINLPNLRSYVHNDNITGSQVLKIAASKKTVGYFNLFPSRKSDHNILFVNGLYASKLGFSNKAQVSIQLLQNVPACVTAWLEPVSVDDWEILELHAEQVESNLLDQIRVLWAGQVFPLWVDGSVCIFLKTVAIEPESQCAILMPLTELVVEPKVSREMVENFDRRQKSRPESTVKEVPDPEVASPDPEVAGSSTANVEVATVENHSFIWRLFRLTFLRRFFRFLWYILRLVRNRIVSSFRSVFSILYHPSTAIKDKSEVSRDENVQDLYRLNDFPGQLDLILRVEPILDEIGMPSWNQAGCIVLNATSDDSLYRASVAKTKTDTKGCENINKCNNKYDDTGIFLVNLQKLPSQREQDLKVSNQKTAEKGGSGEVAKNAVVRMCVQSLSQFAMILRQNGITDDQALDVPSCSLKMSSDLRRQLRISAFSRVRIKKLKSVPKSIVGNVKKISFRILEVFPAASKNSPLADLNDSFDRWLSIVADKVHPLPVTVGTIVCVPTMAMFSLPEEHDPRNSDQDASTHVELVIEKLQLEPNVASMGNDYFLLSYEDLKHLEMEFCPASPDMPQVSSLDQLDSDVPQDSVEGLIAAHQRLLSDCLTHAETVLLSRPLPCKLPGRLRSIGPGCLLVTGPGGVGKSTMCRALLRRLYMLPEHRAYVQLISCSNLKGKKPDTIKKLLQGTIAELEWRQPSVLLLDDIDHLIPSCCSPDGERSPGAMYALQLAAIFKDALMTVCRRKSENNSNLNETASCILVVATATSQQSIHPLLLPSLGCHLFSKTVSMELPQSKERVEILRSMVAKHTDVSTRTVSRMDFDGVAQATEGYSVYDFVQITKRAILSSKSRRSKHAPVSLRLSVQDYDNALSDYVPVSLQDANLHKPKKACWSDVGGLESVRKNLMEKLVWPVKYAQLYQTAGVQLQSGMLLYGPPGCGKTLLAGVVAHECGLNFISVKGPELLSKYIGASEAAVRELFGRAGAAAPCILFFDEFDSIAQKRGHDSTGVTDRVVNQILTHLDGVEPLSGVYVLAATSRPDLIDPALLRPGRLDTHLHCPMPDSAERCSILKALLLKVNVTGEIDVEHLAESCKNFTGADLRALVYDAQLKSLLGEQESIPDQEEEDQEDKRQSSSTDSSFSTAGLELEEHYNSNGMSSILKDLKEEPGSSDDSCSARVTISDFTQTAGELVEAVQSNGNRLVNWGSGDVENHYQICYGLSSPEFSNADLLSLENEVQRTQQVNTVDVSTPRSVYFSSLYSKQPDVAPEAMQSLISTISYANDVQGAHDQATAQEGTVENKITIGISRRHLESAMLSARPSVSAAERSRYIEICQRFTGKYVQSGDEVDGTSEKDVWETLAMMRNQQRATLA